MRLISVESSVRCRAWRGFGHFGSIRLKNCTFLSKWGHITIINILFLLTLFVLLVKNSNASDFCRKLCQMQSVTRIWALEHFVWLGDWKSAHFDQNEDTPQSSILCFWRDFLFDQLKQTLMRLIFMESGAVIQKSYQIKWSEKSAVIVPCIFEVFSCNKTGRTNWILTLFSRPLPTQNNYRSLVNLSMTGMKMKM